MSTESQQTSIEAEPAQVLEIGDLPLSHIEQYANERSDVHFERRGDNTFLVTS